MPNDADFRESVAKTMHELNNVLSVVQISAVQLNADLLDRDALPPGQASDTIRARIPEAVHIVEGLRPEARNSS